MAQFVHPVIRISTIYIVHERMALCPQSLITRNATLRHLRQDLPGSFCCPGGKQVPERRVIPSVPDLCEAFGLDASKKEAVQRKTLTFEDVVARPFFSRHALVRQNRVHENAGENLAPNADYTCCADILHCSIVALRHWVGPKLTC